MRSRTLPLTVALLTLALAVQPAGGTGSDPVVLFFGDSITAGLGVAPEEAFPALVQQRIDDAGLHFEVVNGGVSGETSAGGLRRISWLLQRPVRVLVLELGGNDALRGTDLDATRANLQGIIDLARDAVPDIEIVVAGMQVPPNLGPEYTARFRTLYPSLAAANRAHLIPFLLQGVGGVPLRNQADGIHPNASGHRIVAGVVWQVLEPVLRHLEASTQ